MKKSRFSADQIIGMLKEHQAGIPTAEVCRKHGIAESRSHLEDLLAIDDPGGERTPVHHTGSHPLLTQGILAISLHCLGFLDQGTKRSAAAIVDARRFAQPTYLAVGLALGSLHSALARAQARLTERSDALAVVATESCRSTRPGPPRFAATRRSDKARSRKACRCCAPAWMPIPGVRPSLS